MKRCLLDVNVLLALLWPRHEGHGAAHTWFHTQGHRAWATSILTQLGPWPLKRVPFVTELAASGPAIEFPVNSLASTVNASNPSSAFPTEGCQIGNSARSEALPGKHCEFDFRLVEPTAVFGRVMDGKSAPDFCRHLSAIEIRE